MANAKEQLLQNCGLQSSLYAHLSLICVEISKIIIIFCDELEKTTAQCTSFIEDKRVWKSQIS